MLSERNRRMAIGVVAVVGLQIAAIAIYRWVEGARSATALVKPFPSETLAADTTAPDILLERADGTHISLRAMDNEVRLVHFWATWCPPCVDELPGLLATSGQLGLTLIAISMDEDWDVIRGFFEGSIPAGIYRAVETNAHEKFDVATLPDSYLVSRDGRLQQRYGGARNWLSTAARDHLRAQLSIP